LAIPKKPKRQKPMQLSGFKILNLLAITEAELNLANSTPPRVLYYAKIILLQSVGENWSML
jgi:hypothetical protein